MTTKKTDLPIPLSADGIRVVHSLLCAMSEAEITAADDADHRADTSRGAMRRDLYGAQRDACLAKAKAYHHRLQELAIAAEAANAQEMAYATAMRDVFGGAADAAKHGG